MINETLHLVISFTIGLALGALYLGTLWIAVRRLPRAKRPGFSLLSSAVLRIVLLLTAWYWIADGSWEILLACLLGFLILRFAATWWVTAGVKRPIRS
jgi:F1F0 ATPase subunit 2